MKTKFVGLKLKKPDTFYLLPAKGDKVLGACVAQSYEEAEHLLQPTINELKLTSWGICYWRTYNLCHKLF
jgi:hypothetical protein